MHTQLGSAKRELFTVPRRAYLAYTHIGSEPNAERREDAAWPEDHRLFLSRTHSISIASILLTSPSQPTPTVNKQSSRFSHRVVQQQQQQQQQRLTMMEVRWWWILWGDRWRCIAASVGRRRRRRRHVGAIFSLIDFPPFVLGAVRKSRGSNFFLHQA